MAERHPFPSTRKPIVLIEHTARTGGRAASPSPCRVSGDFSGDPAVSSAVESEVELTGAAPIEQLRALVDHVDRIAEIPNSLRVGTPVQLCTAQAAESPADARSPTADVTDAPPYRACDSLDGEGLGGSFCVSPRTVATRDL